MAFMTAHKHQRIGLGNNLLLAREPSKRLGLTTVRRTRLHQAKQRWGIIMLDQTRRSIIGAGIVGGTALIGGLSGCRDMIENLAAGYAKRLSTGITRIGRL